MVNIDGLRTLAGEMKVIRGNLIRATTHTDHSNAIRSIEDGLSPHVAYEDFKQSWSADLVLGVGDELSTIMNMVEQLAEADEAVDNQVADELGPP